MIYITGDTHGEFNKRFSTKNFWFQSNLTKDDYVIICGDFGGIWKVGWESKEEKYWLNWLEEKPFTLLFIDGNHENFDRLNGYPQKEWHGGKIHEIRPHIYHLMRGQVFELCGKKIFTFGGASSHDTKGGILELEDPAFKTKKKRLDREFIPYRINHLTWWKEEMPSKEEMEEGKDNLCKHNYTVDYIITHCCSTRTQIVMGVQDLYPADAMTDYLEYIKNYANYEKWFFGHYHMDKEVNDKETLVSEKIVRVC